MPDVCTAANGDVITGYCQIVGKYQMEFPEFSTIDTYEQMFDSCGSTWPDYFREPEC